MRSSLVEYITGMFAIIPLTVGLARIKVLHKNYYWFLSYLLLDLIYELVAPFVYGILYINIIQNIVRYVSVFFLLILLFKWGYLKNNRTGRRLLFLLFASLLIIELLTQNNNQLKTPWCFMIFSFVWLMAAVQFISDGLSNSNRKKTNWSQYLILLPLITIIIYYIILNILMAFLYNKETEHFFLTLLSVIVLLQIISQICFALALLWAPKNEVYLAGFKKRVVPKLVD